MGVQRSKLMDELYSEESSKNIYNMLEELDSSLNEEIQKIAYDHYWAIPGLSIRDKALVTVTSLIVMGKEEQTRPHMIGFLNTGGKKETIIGMLIHLSKFVNIFSIKKGFEAISNILKEKNEYEKIIDEVFYELEKNNIYPGKTFELSKRDENIIDFSACVAIGKQNKTEESIVKFVAEKTCSKIDLKYILIHQIVYCGFPSAVNGFRAIKATLNDKI